ncbi:MAG TPA: glycosyltransferase 87 family protein [Puia sp.]|nr:glycosyltransferase 87 family protein [Puia sp.]
MTKNQKYIIIAFVAISFLLVLAKSFYYTEKYGGVDLRHHVIASRLLATDHSPYLYKPEVSDGDFLLEGHRSIHKIGNGTTVTPSMLFILHPLSLLPYKTIRMIWLFVQFILLTAILFIAIRSSNDSSKYFIPLSITIAGIVCSDAFFMHIERGQVYILYAFLIALSYAFFKSKNKYGYLISGIIIGILIFIRPLIVVFPVAFILIREKKWIYGCAIGIIAGFILFVLPKPALWKDYFTAMRSIAEEYTNKSQHADPSAIIYRNGTIEGMNNLQSYGIFKTGNLDTFHNYFEMLGINISLNTSLIIFAAIVLMMSIAFYRTNGQHASADLLFLYGFLLYILSEVFIIAPRSSYCIVEWVLPVFIIANKFQANETVVTFMIAGLLLLHGFPFNFPFQFDIAEAMLVCLLAYAVFKNQKTAIA